MSGHEIERSAAWNREPCPSGFENLFSFAFDISSSSKLDRFPGSQNTTDFAFGNRSCCFHIKRRIVVSLTELLRRRLYSDIDDLRARISR